ncbi:hypothetical protein V5799_024109 [Amblyomma americanum]|uniref:Fucosyltransferase n=1 Tax=Amblyomma americanum TaxID=6943 RepID=A0AAQ4ECY5_AMBAM
MADAGIRKRTPIPPEGGQGPDEIRATCAAAIGGVDASQSRSRHDEGVELLGMEVLDPKQCTETYSGQPSESESSQQESSEPAESTALLLTDDRIAQLTEHIGSHACGYIIVVVVGLLFPAIAIVAAIFGGSTPQVPPPTLPTHPWVSWRKRIGDDEMPRILLWNQTAGANRRRTYNDILCNSEDKGSVMCSVTEDRFQLKESDAIIFDAHRQRVMFVPSKRAAFQLWVFRAQHPPPPMGNAVSSSSSLSLPRIATKFNLTMGYRHDADVVVPYKTWRCGLPADKPLSAPSNNSDGTQYQFKVKKDAAWIHGDCERNRFERAMRSLHAAGDPGLANITTSRANDTVRLRLLSACGDYQCSSGANCIRHVAENYHFIVVSLDPECFQSVYEVIYGAFEYDLVPVVLTPPNTLLDVPHHSVVSSAQLQEPGKLAAYLRALLDDRQEYEAYFAWKQNCTVVAPENELCPLCRVLWAETEGRSHHPDVQEWWTRRSRCRDEPLFGLDSSFLPEL